MPKSATSSRPLATPPRASPDGDGDSPRRYPPGNRLLAALAPDDAAWLAPHLERVPLEIREVLAEAGDSFTHIYFPETAVVSVVKWMIDGSAVEVGTGGNEGMVGVAAFLDAESSEGQTFAQIRASRSARRWR